MPCEWAAQSRNKLTASAPPSTATVCLHLNDWRTPADRLYAAIFLMSMRLLHRGAHRLHAAIAS